jgi:hypothetical protein
VSCVEFLKILPSLATVKKHNIGLVAIKNSSESARTN